MGSKARLWISIIAGVALTASVVLVATQSVFDAKSYIAGFLTSLIVGIVLLLLSFRTVILKHTFVEGSWVRLIYTILIVLACGLVAGYASLAFKSAIETNAHIAELAMQRSSALVEAERRSGQAAILAQVITTAELEVTSSPTRSLSDDSIDKIAAISYSLKPYHRLSEDTLSSLPLSPERGEILVLLSALNIDTNSLRSIYLRTSFEGADLTDANLRGAYLRDIDLQHASLKNANLDGVELSGANLTGAHLWGISLNNSRCIGTKFRRCNMQWAELNNSVLTHADFSSSNLSSSKLRNSDLDHALIEWAVLDDAFLDNSKVRGVSLLGSRLHRAHLKGLVAPNISFRRTDLKDADLSNAYIIKANLDEIKLDNTNMTGTSLDSAIVKDLNWLESLSEYNVRSSQQIQGQYKIVQQPSGEQTYLIVRKDQ